MTTTTGPAISLLMPVYDTPARLLRIAVGFVLGQTDIADFELIVVDDGSSSPEVAPILAEFARGDDRLHVVSRPSNGGIVSASNDCLRLARGGFVGMIDHDDRLDRRALELCTRYLADYPDCDLLYTDEDWIDLDDELVGPFWKPDWSPERLRAQNYVNHLTLLRRSLVERLGGFRAGFDGSQDYDLILRAANRPARSFTYLMSSTTGGCGPAR